MGVTVLNSPGTIDADYRGEVAVILINFGTEPFVVARGERIAQVIVAPVARVKLRESKKLSATKRGARWFWLHGSPRDAIPIEAFEAESRCDRSGRGANRIPPPKSFASALSTKKAMLMGHLCAPYAS